MSEVPRIIVSPTTGITPEQARDVRVRAWAHIFSCWHAKQKDAPPQTEELPQMIAKQGR